MTYNYYLECYGNGVKVRHYLEGYETLKEVEQARREFLESKKVVETARVLYTFNGIDSQKYNPAAYQTLSRFNAKAFYEYWS